LTPSATDGFGKYGKTLAGTTTFFLKHTRHGENIMLQSLWQWVRQMFHGSAEDVADDAAAEPGVNWLKAEISGRQFREDIDRFSEMARHPLRPSMPPAWMPGSQARCRQCGVAFEPWDTRKKGICYGCSHPFSVTAQPAWNPDTGKYAAEVRAWQGWGYSGEVYSTKGLKEFDTADEATAFAVPLARERRDQMQAFVDDELVRMNQRTQVMRVNTPPWRQS